MMGTRMTRMARMTWMTRTRFEGARRERSTVRRGRGSLLHTNPRSLSPRLSFRLSESLSLSIIYLTYTESP